MFVKRRNKCDIKVKLITHKQKQFLLEIFIYKYTEARSEISYKLLYRSVNSVAEP
jgi:hypothetical protein